MNNMFYLLNFLYNCNKFHMIFFVPAKSIITVTVAIHNDNICKRVAPVCYFINQLRDVIDKSGLTMYYHVYFHSLISYAISAWGAASDSVKVFELQKKSRKIYC